MNDLLKTCCPMPVTSGLGHGPRSHERGGGFRQYAWKNKLGSQSAVISKSAFSLPGLTWKCKADIAHNCHQLIEPTDIALPINPHCRKFTCAIHGNSACTTTQHPPWPLCLACTRPAHPSSDAMRSGLTQPYVMTLRRTLAPICHVWPSPDPAQLPPDPTHPQHTCASPTHRTHVPVTSIPC
jgi:hypothetical protein